MEELLKQNPAPDKAAQQMAWVQHMNALKMQSRGSDPERTDFQLSFFLTETEQIAQIDQRAETEQVSAFFFFPRRIGGRPLASGSGY